MIQDHPLLMLKRCFMYCGDERCTCDARAESELIRNSQHLTTKGLVDRINAMRTEEAPST